MVQYRETDFNFISRLLQQEGIFYFFEHAQGKHTLVPADSPVAHPALPGTPKISYQQGSGSGGDVVTRLAAKREWRPGTHAMNDHDFETPSANLEITVASAVEVAGNRRYELYEHPGDYRQRAQGEALARIRMQEIESISQVVDGTSSCRAMVAGYRFALTGHQRRELNREYVITYVRHEAKVNDGGGTEAYTNEFMAIPHAVPFRPLRRTPQPVVRGPETGFVVGPKGEEIFVVEYGRVKVQFHWGRERKSDENSFGWIRVAQPWAGKQRGTLFIPRVGDEVLIQFLHGDLRRPIVVGSLYNGYDRPPYALPAGRTITRFEDKKNSGEIYFHAQKNWQTVIENDAHETIGNSKILQVGGNRTETVGRAQSLTIGGACQLMVGAAMSERVGSNKQLEIGGAFSEAIGPGFKSDCRQRWRPGVWAELGSQYR
jgi:type VI secretion system secreted protein VgrG